MGGNITRRQIMNDYGVGWREAGKIKKHMKAQNARHAGASVFAQQGSNFAVNLPGSSARYIDLSAPPKSPMGQNGQANPMASFSEMLNNFLPMMIFMKMAEKMGMSDLFGGKGKTEQKAEPTGDEVVEEQEKKQPKLETKSISKPLLVDPRVRDQSSDLKSGASIVTKDGEVHQIKAGGKTYTAVENSSEFDGRGLGMSGKTKMPAGSQVFESGGKYFAYVDMSKIGGSSWHKHYKGNVSNMGLVEIHPKK